MTENVGIKGYRNVPTRPLFENPNYIRKLFCIDVISLRHLTLDCFSCLKRSTDSGRVAWITYARRTSNTTDGGGVRFGRERAEKGRPQKPSGRYVGGGHTYRRQQTGAAAAAAVAVVAAAAATTAPLSIVVFLHSCHKTLGRARVASHPFTVARYPRTYQLVRRPNAYIIAPAVRDVRR